MLAHAGQAILHGCLAAVFIEGVMRAWRVRDPAARLRLRLVALLAPLASTTLLPWAVPARGTRQFLVTWSVFSGTSWDVFRVGAVGVSTIATVVLAVAGIAFFLRDTLPFLIDVVRARHDDEPVSPDAAAAARITAALARFAPGDARGTHLVLLATDTPVLYCSGVERPHLTVSTGTLALLSDDELHAAVAHEFVHIRRRDPAFGWTLMAIRTLQAFNPASQIVARQIVDDLERRADQDVAEAGLGAPLARAVATLSSRSQTRSDLSQRSRLPAFVRSMAARAADEATAARCERILTAERDVHACGPLHLGLAATALATLLLFVV